MLKYENKLFQFITIIVNYKKYYNYTPIFFFSFIFTNIILDWKIKNQYYLMNEKNIIIIHPYFF